MKYCKKCVQPDTRPGMVIDDDGICLACKYYFEEFPTIDWEDRSRQLQQIADEAKTNSGEGFDCVVGISGGKDSTFQSLYARDQLGLKVLLVNCAPDGITEVGRKNLENLVQHGFDMISIRPNPKVMKMVTRRSFFEYGNPVKPSEYPLYVVSYITALKFGIPLIIQGENDAITLGLRGTMDPDGDALNLRKTDTLAGCNSSDWVQDGIELKDLLFYQWPADNELRRKVVAVHLNYYVKEFSQNGNTKFARAHGFRGRQDHDPNLTGRLSPYTSIDADMQIVNQMIKYYKLGFGFVTDEVCYNIREVGLDREEGIELIEKYDGKCDARYIREFCEYIDISENEFWETVNKFVSRELFRKDEVAGKWVPLFKVGQGLIANEVNA